MGPDRMELNLDFAVRRLSLASEELNFFPDMPDLPDDDDGDDDPPQAYMSLGACTNKGGSLGENHDDDGDDYEGKDLKDLRRLSMSSVMSSMDHQNQASVIAL